MRIFALSPGRHEEHSAYVELFYRDRSHVWIVVRMERLQFGATYGELHTIADYVAREIRDLHEEQAPFVVDITGLGQPVINLLEEKGLAPIPVVVSAETMTFENEDGVISIPKREIDSTLLIFRQRHIIRFRPDNREQSDMFDREFSEFVSPDVYISGGTEKWRRGDNDDQLLALGLGCWYGEYLRSRAQRDDV